MLHLCIEIALLPPRHSCIVEDTEIPENIIFPYFQFIALNFRFRVL